MKRFVSWLLCVCLIISLLSSAEISFVFAASSDKAAAQDDTPEPIVTGADFESAAQSFYINTGEKTISAIIKEGTEFLNPTFTVDTENIATSLYYDEDCTQPAESITYEQVSADGMKTYYLLLQGDGFADVKYKVVIISNKAQLDFSNAFFDPTGTIKNTAALLLHSGSFSTGQKVTETFNGMSYVFTVGVNAFSSIAEARAANVKQLILTAGDYAGITIDGSIELYGPGYAVNPNVVPDDRTQQWQLSDKFADTAAVAKISGQIVISEAATPSSEEGTRIVIKGVSIGSRIMDTYRKASVYKTDITIENCLLSFNSTGFVYRFANGNTDNTDASKPNIDSLTMKNCRYNFVKGDNGQRVFTENSPAYVTLDGLYFDNKFPTLGYPKWKDSVINGSYVVKNCYFRDYLRTSDDRGNPKPTVIAPTGHAQYCSAEGKQTHLLFENNIVIDAASDKYNSSDFVFAAIYPDAFTDITFKDNTFIDTNNYLSVPFIASAETYAPMNKDYSDRIIFEGNRLIGYSPFITVNSQTETLTRGSNNYYAPYTEDFASAQNGTPLFGVLEGSDYYLDYAKTTLASSMDMVIDRKLAVVNNVTREASLVIGEDEDYYSDIKTSDGLNRYNLYSDEACLQSISTLNSEIVGDGTVVYAKTTNAAGVSVVYRVYVSVGDVNAAEPITVGEGKIDSPYLFCEETENMPHGTKFTVSWEGTEYVFTAGVNAFASVAQIIAAHGGDSVPNVIMPGGVYNGDVIATSSVNFYGENGSTVLTSEPDVTTPVKIACVGDAITEGNGLSEDERADKSYPAQLKSILDEKYGDGKYEVRNFGCDGATVNIQSNAKSGSYNYWTYIYSVQYYMSLDYNPDIVIIMMGSNDTLGQAYSSPEMYKKQYQALIDSYTQLPSHPAVVIAGSPAMSSGLRSQLLTETIIPMQKQVARDNGLIYIDTYTQTSEKLNDTSYFTGDLSDDMKCTEKGYGFIADIIAQGIAPIMSSQRSVTKNGITVDPSQRTETPQKVKVACVGDSLTYGDKSDKGYPVFLQQMLGDGYEVRNFGECGAVACDMSTYNYSGGGTNWVYQETLRYKYSMEWKPDIVILMLGVNDTGAHLTNFHSVNWDGGANSSAAAEFEKDYKSLVERYQNNGAQVYCVNCPSGRIESDRDGTSVKISCVNPIIERVAGETGCNLIDIYSETKNWDDGIYTDTVHFNSDGYKNVSDFIFSKIFSDFADSYYDKYGEISKNAVILDAENDGTLATGTKVKYSWEGSTYNFTWGVNAFQSIDDIIVYANENGISDIQVLIPENNLKTEDNKYFFITADVTNIKSIEVYGQNRLIDPNDKSASYGDASADWTLSTQWDKYSVSGGTSSVGSVIISSNNLAGRLEFKGITMRDIFFDRSRVAGSAEDPRNLSVVFENSIADFTALSNYAGFLFDCKSPRAANTGSDYGYNDFLTVKNFRVEHYFYKSASNNRIVNTGNMNNMIFEGFYFNEDNNLYPGNNVRFALSQFGYVASTSASAQTGSVIFSGCNFRNAESLQLTINGYTDNAAEKGVTEKVVFDNNVVYNCSKNRIGVNFQPSYITSLSICGNIFINTVSTQPVVGSTTASNDVDYVEKIGYTARDNTFVLSDITSTRYLNFGTGTVVDSTGTYLAEASDDYSNAVMGIAPNFGKADYYYADFARNVKNTDFALTSAYFGDKIENVQINGDVVSADGTNGQVVDTLEFACVNPLISAEVYGDEQCTEKLSRLTLNENNSTDIYYIKLSYKDYSGAVYTLKFNLGEAKAFADAYEDENGIIKNTAVLYAPNALGKNAGDKLNAVWNDIQYVFTYGENAFATLEEIRDKFGAAPVQIILPAGSYGQLDIYGSWSIFGEGFSVNPNGKGDQTLNSSWNKYGETIIDNADVVISESATPGSESGTNILISGVRLTGKFVDTNRHESEYATNITLKNIVYDRCFLTGGEREFNLQNANSMSSSDTAVNSDSFNIENMFYIGTNASGEHALFEDTVAPFVTIDGFVSVDNTPSFGNFTVSKTARKVEFTLKNSYFYGCKSSAALNDNLITFVGHNADVSSEQRRALDTKLNIVNNKFINCGNESEYNGQTLRTVIALYPQSFNSINFVSNEFVSTRDFNYLFVTAKSDTFSVNSGDYSDCVTFKDNRVIGIMATFFLNEDTVVDHSDNYFATYTSDYKTAANGDIPSDYKADVYLDYAMTVKRSDMAPVVTNIYGFTVDNETLSAYGYASRDFTPMLGEGCRLYADKTCKSELKIIDVNVGQATTAYIKVTRGNISKVYTLYVMGVRNLSDIENATISPQIVDGIDNPAVYYPTLYGAPDGITLYTYYDNTCYGFVTGKNVVTSTANMVLYSNELLVPDDIFEINFSVVSGIKLHSKNANISGVEVRKLKIACIGDSITQGVGAGSTADYPSYLQKYLGSEEYIVQNFGKGSATVQSDERGYMVFAKEQHEASLAFEPDVVICALGTNDSRYNIWTSNSSFIDTYIDIIDTYRALDSKPAIYITTTLQRADDLMNNERVEKNTIYLDEYIAKMVGGKIIDTHDEMRPYTNDTSYFGDALHPTAIGYEKMANYIGSCIVANMNRISQTGITLDGLNITGPVTSDSVEFPLTVRNADIRVGTLGRAKILCSGITQLIIDNTTLSDGETVSAALDLGRFIEFGDGFTVENESSLVIGKSGEYKMISDDGQTVPLSVNLKPDSSVLKELINKALSYSNDDNIYCAKSFDNLLDVVSQAEQKLENASQSELDSLAVMLQSAIDELKIHDWDEGNIAVAPTCKTEGVIVYICKNDPTEMSVEKMPANPDAHVWDDGVVTTPATCETDGVMTYTCTECSETKTEVIAKLGHAWDEGVVTKEATCSAEGEKLFTCKNDKTHTRTEVIAINPDAHKWGEYVYNNDATEEADGTETRKCEYCGKEETRTAEGTKLEPEHPPVDSAEIFPDIEEGRWYKEYIDYVAQYGLMNGNADGTFAPNGKLNRAQFVQILANLSGVDTSNRDVETTFEDVPANKWYTPAVKWASENGIVDGMEPGKFMPLMDIQRQQICVMIVRYAEYAGITLDAKVDEMVFADETSVKNYAKEAVVICQRAGIIDGMDGENNTKIFAPADTATRAQVATMMTRFHENFVTVE